MQHGLPQHEVGYVPVVADRVLTWSQSASDWFLARGTDPARLAVVGNPAFDRYASAADPLSRPGREPGGARVLAALTPSTGRSTRSSCPGASKPSASCRAQSSS